jgi:hypothetical protein
VSWFDDDASTFVESAKKQIAAKTLKFAVRSHLVGKTLPQGKVESFAHFLKQCQLHN